MKKFIAIVLALATVLGLCACGNTGNTDDTGADGKVKIRVGVNTNANVVDYGDTNELTAWLEAQTGFELEVLPYSGGSNVATQIATTVAAGKELPDIIWDVALKDDVISSYGKDGYFVDLTSYYEDKEGKSATFWQQIEENLDEEGQKAVMMKITDPDTGEIYSIPTVKVALVDNLRFMPYINTKWLEKVGKKAPTNKDELYDVLVAFRDQDPNGNGKKDEIPLYGSEYQGNGANAIKWIINMFIYYEADHPWQDYNGDGKLEYVYTQPEYREALKFVNKLYDEGLLTKSIYTLKNAEMRTTNGPASGVALTGIFCGHLSTMITQGSEVLYEYQPLEQWGYVTEKDTNVTPECFITETAEKKGIVDECFELMMLMWTKEGARRIRYGAEGTNWTAATEGAVTAYGIKAEFKLLNDPLYVQNFTTWGQISGTFSLYDEAENAEVPETEKFATEKAWRMAEQRRIADEVGAKNNPKNLAPTLYPTTAEDEAIDATRTNINSYQTTASKDFVCGSNGQDIDNDAHWAAYLAKLDELGLKKYAEFTQTVYDRQMAQK